MKKNVLWGMLFLATLLLGFTSCSDDDDSPIAPPVIAPDGAYILSAGKMNSNTASLAYYNLNNKTAYETFESTNGIALGDVGQDMIVYGSKMYIAVYNSGVIYVTDKNARILATIKDDTNKLQPRHFEAYKGNIYVTLFDGYLARIDTTSLAIDKRIAVGPNPESVKAVNNKLYVANSGGMNWEGGYNNTVSIVNPELTSKKDIIVAVNPVELKVDIKNNLYLVSRGDYDNIPNKLQQINTSNDAVTVLDEGRSYSIYPIDNKLYILNKGYDKDWNPYSNFLYYDINTKKIVEQSFITDETIIKDANSLSVEPISGDYYVSVANGTNNGDVYIYSSAGKYKSKFDTGGTYPSDIWFVKK